MLRRALEKEGWTVTEAADGREALAKLQDQQVDLVLLDLMMPVMDGFAFLEELRRTEEGRRTAVVVVTAKELTAQERESLQITVGNVIQKGRHTPAELLAQLRMLMARSENPSRSERF